MSLLTLERVALLHSVGFFAGVPTRVIASVARLAEEVEKNTGDSLIVEGEDGDCMYVVARGRVRIEKGSRVLAELGAGEVVGELSVLSPGPRHATAVVLEPSLFLRVDQGIVTELLLDHPQVTEGIIDMLVRRLRQTELDRWA